MAEHEEREQKTEEATPRRREEARERGQVALSTELVAALALAGGAAGLWLGGPALLRDTAALLTRDLGALGSAGLLDLDVDGVTRRIADALSAVGLSLALVVSPALAIAVLSGYGQVGFRMAGQALQLDLTRVDPVQGWRRLFGARALVRTLLAGTKIVVIAATVAWVAWREIPGIVRAGDAELGPMLAALASAALRCGGAALLAIVGLALLDFLFQRWQHERDLRMSKQEVKEEHRIMEGDPHVRARIRSLQRQLAMRRMMADVPKATVVVTNPTHYAVALRYRRTEEGGHADRAPVVVAKGVDHLARRIKEVAGAADVVLYEDVPLARALYAEVEIGQAIPESLYAAVAAVLSYVYRLRGELAGAGARSTMSARS
jgi:flagellar biosynthetic protein FlhB